MTGVVVALAGLVVVGVMLCYLVLAISASLRVYGEQILLEIGNRKLESLAFKTFYFLLAEFSQKTEPGESLDRYILRRGPTLLNDLLLQNGYNLRRFDAADMVPAYWGLFKARELGLLEVARHLEEGPAVDGE